MKCTKISTPQARIENLTGCKIAKSTKITESSEWTNHELKKGDLEMHYCDGVMLCQEALTTAVRGSRITGSGETARRQRYGDSCNGRDRLWRGEKEINIDRCDG